MRSPAPLAPCFKYACFHPRERPPKSGQTRGDTRVPPIKLRKVNPPKTPAAACKVQANEPPGPRRWWLASQPGYTAPPRFLVEGGKGLSSNLQRSHPFHSTRPFALSALRCAPHQRHGIHFSCERGNDVCAARVCCSCPGVVQTSPSDRPHGECGRQHYRVRRFVGW